MIVDSHAQIWVKEVIEKLPKEMVREYEKTFGKRFDYSLEDMLQEMEKNEVDKAVVVAVDAQTTFNYCIPNEIVAEIVEKSDGRLIGFAGVDPHKGVVALKEIEKAVDMGFKGLKFMPHLHMLNPNDEKMYPIYEKALEYDLVLLFHSGTQFHRGTKIKYCKPIYFDDVAVDFPDLKIIIAHFGYPWYEEALAVVRRNKNVYFNIAGWSPKYIPDTVIRQMNSILQEKVLFGTDYPLMSYERVLKELKDLNLKKETYEKMFYKNAKKIGII